MNIESALTHIPAAGNCTMDIDKAVKLFDSKCLITRWKESYRLVRVPRVNPTLKVTISKPDAMALIAKLELVERPSTIFKSASTFRLNQHNDE